VSRYPRCGGPGSVRAALVLVLGLAVSGCGGSGRVAVAPVEGKVLYRGEPLKFGAVTFQPAAGPPATGKIQSDGTFHLSTYGQDDGAAVGKHQVTVTCMESQAPNAPPPDPNKEPGLGKPLIPQKYLSPQTSGLTAEVKDRNEPFVFELRD
jgi:hypothetical protein